jgi:hypothetical protein
MGFRNAKCIAVIVRGSVLNFCVNDTERSVCTSTEMSTKISTVSSYLTLGGHISENCEIEQ